MTEKNKKKESGKVKQWFQKVTGAFKNAPKYKKALCIVIVCLVVVAVCCTVVMANIKKTVNSADATPTPTATTTVKESAALKDAKAAYEQSIKEVETLNDKSTDEEKQKVYKTANEAANKYLKVLQEEVKDVDDADKRSEYNSTIKVLKTNIEGYQKKLDDLSKATPTPSATATADSKKETEKKANTESKATPNTNKNNNSSANKNTSSNNKASGNTNKSSGNQSATNNNSNSNKGSGGTTHKQTCTTTWVQDKAAWDETVVDKAAWDETVVDQAAWDETVCVYTGDVVVCNGCGARFNTYDEYDAHRDIYASQGDWSHSGYHTEPVIQNQIVHHPAVTHVVHHPATTHVVHHNATGHNVTTCK